MNTPSAVAARPILASSLLPPESEDDDRSTSSSEDEDEWRLGPEIYGDEASKKPAAAIVSPGRILGISSLILSIDPGGKTPNGREYVQEWVDELSLHLLISTITRNPTANLPRAFIIQFKGCRPLSSSVLQGLIREKMTDLSLEAIKGILRNVNIFQALEFGQIQSAVDQVSDLLFKIEQGQSKAHNEPGVSASARPDDRDSTTQSENRPRKRDPFEPPILLLIEGMDVAIQETIRSSDTDTAGDRLCTFLRTLALLCGTYKSLLAVIIANSITLRPEIPKAIQMAPDELRTQVRNGLTPAETALTTPYRLEDMNFPVESVFEPPDDRRLISGSPYPYGLQLFPFADELDEGIDVHLVVSGVDNERVVEIVKDREGNNLGRWDVF
ncbi:hypothetical protein H109_06990 [Trichophyton interdigitale MR816]|uniref:Uncharacterized protein n=1 Tax=Trichophyton interdigitale (strain MR816) TaxID=1215338 RepID=A0A059IZW8_TRIIM|nr:hypothetical protein H101_05772 [Trichophyton interdigitale H6]KDB21069.1 hypothetical protein H109_06990 [Trichophyton interdigitale MR816]